MLYSYEMKKDSIYTYNKIFIKKVNKPYNRKNIFAFSLSILIIFSIINYISVTPDFILIIKNMNLEFFIAILLALYFIYIVLRNFFKKLNCTDISSTGILVNDFYKDGYTININDTSNTMEIMSKYISNNLNLLEDINKVCLLKNFIAVTFNGNTVFLPKEKNIIILLEKCKLL